jgi:hypothetical protein
MIKKRAFVKKAGKKPTSPCARAGHLFLNDDRDETLYVLGGYTELGPISDIWGYQPSSSSWQQLSNGEMSRQSPFPRFEFDGCVVGSNIYLFGGFQSDGREVSILNDLWVFNKDYQAWKIISEESSAPERSGHVCVAVERGRFIVHGGTCMGFRQDLWVYSTSHNKWHEINSSIKPCARSMHSATYCRESGILAIFGGVTEQISEVGNDPSPIYLNDLWVMHLNDDMSQWNWSMVEFQSIAPSPRDLPALVAVGDGVMIFGGFGLVEIPDDLSDIIKEDEDNEGEEEEIGVGVDSEKRVVEETNTERFNDEPVTMQSEVDATMENSMEIAYLKEDVQITGEHKVHFEFELNKKIAVMAEEVDEDDDDNSVAMNYLADAWYINLKTGESKDFDICSIIGKHESFTEEKIIITPPRRGCKLILLPNSKIISFGGFDGETFYSKTEELSSDILKNSLESINLNHKLQDYFDDSSEMQMEEVVNTVEEAVEEAVENSVS